MNFAEVIAREENGVLRFEVNDPHNTGQTLIDLNLLMDMFERLNELEQNEENFGLTLPISGDRTVAKRMFYRTIRDRSAVARLRRRDSHRSRQSSGGN